MNGQGKIRAYKKGCGYSYITGAFGAIELLRVRPEAARIIYLHSAYTGSGELTALCESAGVRWECNDAALRRISSKENTFVAGVFDTYTDELRADRPHVVLVQPSDAGNLGTIVRTLVGLGLPDIAVVEPAVDGFHPKTVRATMGALFRARIARYPDFDAYRTAFPGHRCYPFMLENALALGEVVPPQAPYSLIFGNEATGLPPEFAAIGQPVRIEQSAAVDSLNLSIAVGIGAYAFAARGNKP